MIQLLGNKTLYKIFLIFSKFSSYVYALFQILALICYQLELDVTLLSYLGGCSITTIILLFLISYVFKFCLTHRIPIFYSIFVYVISLIDNLYPIANIFRVHFIFVGLFILIYIYIWYKCRNVPKIDHVVEFCKNYCK